MWATLLIAVTALVGSTYGVPSPAPPAVPSGGVGTNDADPYYHPLSDFDFQSLNLALNQEYIELDLFNYGLSRFSVDEFEEAGINADYRYLIEYMADQERGHAIMLSNIVGASGAKECEYQYPFDSVEDFVDFCQKLTRWGESGVYGFLPHLNSRAAAELLINSITTEARQQMVFRQFEGTFPMAVWFIVGIPQDWAWTLLSPWITHCPDDNPLIEWQNFPALTITNNPSAVSNRAAAISYNVTGLSYSGREVHFTWEDPGKITGYDGKYLTTSSAGKPQYVVWASQLNTTYTELYNIQGNSGTALQPGGAVFGDGTAPTFNDTMFVAITDDNPYITPFNISMLNPHIVAGPAVYQAG